jgi:hypothetical protein
MSFEIMHFRGSEKILKEKRMGEEIKLTIEYLYDALFGTCHKSELLRQALEEMGWRPKEGLNILDGRRYSYKGLRKRVAMDGSFASYEYIQDALLRLQIGFDKKKIDMGIVLVTSQRSEKSPLGSTKNLVEKEIEYLYPTISLPVTVALFDLGRPYGLVEAEKGMKENEKVKPRNKKDKSKKNTRAGKTKTPESLDNDGEHEIPSPEEELKTAIINESHKSMKKKKRQPVHMPPHSTAEPPLQAA